MIAAELAVRPQIVTCEGCRCDENGYRPYKAWVIPGLVETNRCPRKALEDDPLEVWTWFNFYDDFKAGFLPYGGGMLDQPAVFGEAMRLIEQRVNLSLKEEASDGTARKKGRR